MNITMNSCSYSQSSVIYFPFSILLILFSLFAMSSNAFITFVLHRTHFIHANSRLLLKNFTFACTFLAASVSIKGVFSIIIWHRKGYIGLPIISCAFMDIPFELAFSAATLSICCLGIERLINTVWRRDFSDPDEPSTGAYILTCSCWIMSVIIVVFLIYPAWAGLIGEGPLCYCHLFFTLPSIWAYCITSVYIIIELITLFTFFYLHRHSKREYDSFTINTTQHSLAERHEMLNNIKTISWLMPTTILHASMYISAEIALIYYAQSSVTPLIVSIGILWSNVFAIEPSIQAALMIFRNKSFKDKISSYFPCMKKFCNNQVSPAMPQVAVACAGGTGAGPGRRASAGGWGGPGAWGPSAMAGAGAWGGEMARVGELDGVEIRAPSAQSGYLNVHGHAHEGSSGIVDFHVHPEQHQDIVQAIWSKSPAKIRIEH